MIIYVSKENENLISCLKDKVNSSEIQTITGVKHLKKFVLQEMKNLNNFESIIIDIAGLSDSEDEIIDSFVAIKSMYSVRIIVVALGYQYGNSTLARLFNEGIYNFVTATNYDEQEKELIDCITVGKQYKDSVRYRKVEQISNGKDKVIIKKEYKKLKQCVTIGVAGTQNHIGTTSQALLITKFLTDLKLNVCYIQANGKEDIQTLEDMYDITKKDDFISYENIDMYEKDKTINAMGYGYDFYVYDMGNLQEINDIDSFITKDVRIVVSGTKAWEQDNLLKVFNKLGVLEDINFIFNFTPVEEQSDITKNMGKFGVKTYFSKYVPNPFIPTENEKLYHSLFKDYIAEKSSSLEIVPIKRSIFNLFRRQVK